MSRSSTLNKHVFTWCGSIGCHTTYVGIIAMLLSLYPALSHADRLPTGLTKSNEQDYTSFNMSNLGFFTKAPLFLVADSDNTSSSEDIIFGFDNDDVYQAIERMRLTDEGRLGIGTYIPDGILDVRAWQSMRSYSSSQDDYHGSVADTVARFGTVRPYKWPARESTEDRFVEYYGLKFKVEGQSVDASVTDDDLTLRTTVGLDLVGVREQLANANDDNYILWQSGFGWHWEQWGIQGAHT